jgi:hypothetical protein
MVSNTQHLIRLTRDADELTRLRAFVRLLAEDTDDVVSPRVRDEARRVLGLPGREVEG